MKRVREAIVVEGKYDEIRVRSAVDALVVPTEGFGIFHDKARLTLLRRLAAERGLIILTDSDSAGMLIRNHLIGAIPAEQMRHAYVPPIAGKERRKSAPGKEGLLGVYAVDKMHLTKGDLYELGLSGCADSAQRRLALLSALNLPLTLSANRLLEVLNATITEQELAELLAVLKTADSP